MRVSFSKFGQRSLAVISLFLTLSLGVVPVSAQKTSRARQSVEPAYVEMPVGSLQVVSNRPFGFIAGELPTAAPEAVDPNSVYSNVTNFLSSGIRNGGAAADPAAPANTITRLLADDLHLINAVGTPPYSITSIRFSVASFNATAVICRPRIRFYLADGAGGGPGTSITGFSFDQTTVNPGVTTFSANTVFSVTSRDMWAGITFDNNSLTATNNATAAQLNELGVGFFNPVDRGSSADLAFLTTSNGSFLSNNPAGATFDTPGTVDNHGWELRLATAPTAGGVELSGRVVSTEGRGIAGAKITLSDQDGVSRSTLTDKRGFYDFVDVPSGRTYVISAANRRYEFDPSSQVITVTDNLSNVGFTGSPKE